jgi:hypothetical protein
MKSLEFLSQLPPVKRDNFNRDSSACKSRAGYVIHSGIHRSTAFVSDPEAVASLEYWKSQGQAGLNGWVEATIDGASLEACERNALAKLHPDYTFSRVKDTGKNKGAGFFFAASKGKLQSRIGAGSWQALNGNLG